MNSLEELEKSDNISDRKEYVRRINLHIAKWESELLEIEKLDDGETKFFNLKKNKEAIKNLKNKLSNYDIYKQKFNCRTCQEVECVCYEAGVEAGDPRMSQEFQQGNESKPDKGSENLAALRRETGDNSDSAGSKEDLELPF